MEGDEIVYPPEHIPAAPVAHVVAPAVAPANNAPAALFSSTAGPSTKAGRARRPSSSKKSGEAAPGANPRVSSRLADKRAVAAATFAPSSPSPSSSINTTNGAEILAGIDQEVASAPAFSALAMLAGEADAMDASGIDASGLAALSPPRGNSEVENVDVNLRAAVAAPQATIDTFYSAKSSVLGKRKLEEGEVDSHRDAAAAAAALAEEEWAAFDNAQYNAVMDDAEATLKKIAAARLAGEKKRRKLSHVAPAAAPSASAAAPAGPSTSKKGAKNLGVRKAATKKAAAPRASGTVKKTAPKTRNDPCFPTAMDVDPAPAPADAAVLGSITLEEGVRKSGRISMRQSAAQIVAESEAKAVHRRKQSVPAATDLW